MAAWAYHGTERSRLGRISQRGLVPGAKPRLQDFSREHKFLYLSDDPVWSRGYGGADVLLRFPFPRGVEPDLHPISGRTLPHQWTSTKVVPPRDVEVEQPDGSWLPLIADPGRVARRYELCSDVEALRKRPVG